MHAGKDLEIDAPELRCHAAKLQSTSSEHSESVSVSVTATGNIQSVGASASKSSSSSTHYENAGLSAEGNMKLHHKGEAMDLVELDGANITANTLDMKTKKLRIIDKQDTSENKTQSASASSSGQVSAYKGKGHSKVVNQHSGIAIKEGINNNGHVVEVGETYMEGGRIVTQGKNDFKTDKMEAVTLTDEESYSGIGFSGNVHDFDRLTGEKAQNTAGENAIATFSVSSDRVDYKAKQQATIYGDKGTNVAFKEQVGEVHTSSADGRIIERDVNQNITIDVPLTNQDYLDKSVENIKAGTAKLKEMMADDEPKKEEEPAYERCLAPEFELPDPNERSDEADAGVDALDYDEQDEIEEKALNEQSQSSKALAEVNDDIDDLFDEKEQEYSPYKGLRFFNSAPAPEEDATNEVPEYLKRPTDDEPGQERETSGYDKAVNRAFGALYLLSGIGEAAFAAGTAVESGGAATGLAWILMVNAADIASTGVKQIWTGEAQTTTTFKTAVTVTGSEGFAAGLDLGLGMASIGLGIGSAARSASKSSWNFFKAEENIVEGTGLKARSMSDTQVRVWYQKEMDAIYSKVDPSLSKEKQALQTFTLRNKIKVQARELMSDLPGAIDLDRTSPLKSLKDIARKSYNKNIVGDDFWSNMYSSSSRSNRAVDEQLGLLRDSNRYSK